MIENTARNDSPVRNLSILELSSILCIISPTFFVSKNVRGRRTIFLRKSERNSIFIFELTCNKAHERKKSIENYCCPLNLQSSGTRVCMCMQASKNKNLG